MSLILNDCHFGVTRKGGTTPASQQALRDYLVISYTSILNTTDEDHLVILGDLFDEFTIAARDWVEVFKMLDSWLVDGGSSLTLVAGNHDISARGDKVSDFSRLCEVLKASHSDTVQVIDIGCADWISPTDYAIAHCSNQDLFELELQRALELKPQWLLLHCNLNNHFAQQADQSLDLSAEWAARFDKAGTRILLAHEHQARDVGNVTVLGNQFPTSVADCLGNDRKFAHILDSYGIHRWSVWNQEESDGFAVYDWRELQDQLPDVGAAFVKVVGTATAAEAAGVIAAISDFRRKCPDTVFVVANGVEVDGVVAPDELPDQFQAAEKFDVLDFIRRNLEADEMGAVELLLKD